MGEKGSPLRPGTSGDFRLPADAPLSPTAESMILFLEAVERVAPDAVLSLRDEVLPHPCDDDAQLAWRRRWRLDRWSEEGETLFGQAIGLILSAWAGRWDVFAGGWVFLAPGSVERLRDVADHARKLGRWTPLLEAMLGGEESLRFWREAWLDRRGDWSLLETLRPDLFEPMSLRWDPRAETRSAARQRGRKMLDSYLKRIEQAATELGLIPAAEKRTARHFEWLVRQQLKGERPSEMKGKREGGERTVNAGIRAAAEAIGLEVHPARRGPP